MQALAENTRKATYLSIPPRRANRIPTRSQSTRRSRLRHIEWALPWAGLLTLAVSLAWAMNVGVTNTAIGTATPLDTAPLRTVGGVLQESAADNVDSVEVLTLRRFQEAQVVLTITVEGPDGSADMYCGTTTDRTQFDKVHATTETIKDVFRHLCSAQTD